MIEKMIMEVKGALAKCPSRFTHVMGVYQTAMKLAKHYQVSIEDASIAALYHDLTKCETDEFHQRYLTDEEKQNYQYKKVIHHAISATSIVKSEYPTLSNDVYDAIRYHVWGRPNMSMIEKIVFVSDYCEPNRPFADIEEIYELALENIDQAVLKCMQITIDDLNARKILLHKEQEKAYEYYKEHVYGKN